jgi:hypothetical protein
MRFKRYLLLIILLAALVPQPAAAQTCSQLIWGETRSRSFSFIYQASAPIGAELAETYSPVLDETFETFANLFETSLPLPISVRVYPNQRDYYCMNALAPVIPLGQTHSHLAGREIALIAQNILDHPEDWLVEGLDALRNELAALFVEDITDGNAPPGLVIGTGVYMEDPFRMFERRFSAAPPPTDDPGLTWRALWESPDLVESPEQALQAGSIVAYLVDVYGWSSFLAFLSTLRTSDGYRQALVEVYKVDAGSLEAHWQTYYPLYFQGRWRSNAIYDLDLTVFEQLIASGAYADAASGLEEAIKLLVDLGDTDRLLAAEALNRQAHAGMEADALARQARQAYLEGSYLAAEDFAAQSMEKYNQIGDIRNQEALGAIRSQAAEVLLLNEELDTLGPAARGLGGQRHAARIIEIGTRLVELGNLEGQAHAQELLAAVNQRQQARAVWVGVLGGLAAGGLLLHWALRARKKPPPEAMLQFD